MSELDSAVRVALLNKLLGRHGTDVLVDAIHRCGYKPDFLDAHLKRYLFTTEKPTKPGWYWFRTNTENPTMVEVVKYKNVCMVLEPDDDKGVEVLLYDGEWAGPLEPPV